MMNMALRHRPMCVAQLRGFTLVEMIVAMAITAIIAAGVSLFLRVPVQEYQDAQRRSDITDVADTAFARMKSDLQTALPNSVRVKSVVVGLNTVYYLEFLQMRTSGRYRQLAPLPQTASSANTCPDTNANLLSDENVLTFGVAETCFTSLGTLDKFASIAPNSDSVVVYNLGPGNANADAYSTLGTNNRSLITAVAAGVGGENVIQIQAHTFSPILSESSGRFQVITGPVTYVCDPGAGTLTRVSAYAISTAQQTPPAGTSVRLAQGIAANGCSITYDQNVINQSVGIVSIRLSFSDTTSATSVSLFEEIQVSNAP